MRFPWKSWKQICNLENYSSCSFSKIFILFQEKKCNSSLPTLPGNARISNVEFYHSGQEGFRDSTDPRYAVTFLNLGQVCTWIFAYIQNKIFYFWFYFHLTLLTSHILELLRWWSNRAFLGTFSINSFTLIAASDLPISHIYLKSVKKKNRKRSTEVKELKICDIIS